MQARRAFLFHATMVVAAVSSVFSQQLGPLSEQTFVTAIELVVRVTDQEGRPVEHLRPADFEVLEDGVVRQVIGVEPLGRAPEPPGDAITPDAPRSERAPSWDIVVWVDGGTTGITSLRDAVAILRSEADALVGRGSVSVVYADPAPRMLATRTRDRNEILEAADALARVRPLDRIARIRRAFLDDLDDDRTPNPRMSAVEEMRLIEKSRLRLSAWLASQPKEGPRALFLVSDGFDLDPTDFYEEAVASATNFSMARKLRASLESFEAPLQHELFGRTLALTGWTVFGLGGGGGADFPDDASRRGGHRMSAFLNGIPGARPPGRLVLHPREPLVELAAATGGGVLPLRKGADLFGGLEQRVLVTYQVPRASDGRARKVEIRMKRPGLRAEAPRWASSSPSAEAAGNLAAAILTDPALAPGDLKVEASLTVVAVDRQVGEGELGMRVGLEPLLAIGELAKAARLRLTLAIGDGESQPAIVQQVLDPRNVMREGGLEFEAPVRFKAGANRMAILVEELASGLSGATWVEVVAPAK